MVTNALRLRKFKLNHKKNKNDENDKKEELAMKEMVKTIYIEGMQCNHCKMTVEKALGELEGITKVEVSLEDKKAVIEIQKEIEDRKIKEAISNVGFEVTGIE